jgi:hypothetical protein
MLSISGKVGACGAQLVEALRYKEGRGLIPDGVIRYFH